MACRGSTIALFLMGALLIQQISAQKGCNQACASDDECSGQLACTNGKCNDDPGVGTHICAGASPPPPPGGGDTTCQPSGYITGIASDKCNTDHMSECCKAGERYGKYLCSPPITPPATKATLTLNGFGPGQDGGGAPACTPDRFYDATESVVALSTGWFGNYARCGRRIRVTGNGKSAVVTVVDECDSRAGCDDEHAFQPPCRRDVVDASEAVWRALGVAESQWGELAITWSQVDCASGIVSE